MKRSIFLGGLLAALAVVSGGTVGSALACSNLDIVGDNDVIVARSMDYEMNTGSTMGLGLVGERNTSNLNMNRGQVIQAATWNNRHNYLGKAVYSHNLVEGINDAGVYAAYLYLPHFTQYPQYDPNALLPGASVKPSLGVSDVVNYVLAMSDNTQDALNRLEQLQLIANAATVRIDNLGLVNVIAPMHIVIRDQTGASAVIEFIAGRTVIYRNTGPVITNAPTYDWQQSNAHRYDYVRTGNTDFQQEGILMNGSGFMGIPGDWAPPGRFARATQVIQHMPRAYTAEEMMGLALSALHSIEVPLSANPSPTLWESLSDLRQHRYYFKSLYTVTNASNHTYAVASDVMDAWKTYALDDITVQYTHEGRLPVGWVHATIMPATVPLGLINLMSHSASESPSWVVHMAQ